VLTSAVASDEGVSPLPVRLAELALAGGAAYLLDDAAAPLTGVTPPGAWRRRAPTLLAGAGVLVAAWLTVLGLLRWQDSLPTAVLPTIEVTVLSLLSVAAAAIGVRRGESEPGGQVAPLVGLLGISALIADFMLEAEIFLPWDVGQVDAVAAGTAWWAATGVVALAVIAVGARDPGSPSASLWVRSPRRRVKDSGSV
jgi:hypothetical protein